MFPNSHDHTTYSFLCVLLKFKGLKYLGREGKILGGQHFEGAEFWGVKIVGWLKLYWVKIFGSQNF